MVRVDLRWRWLVKAGAFHGRGGQAMGSSWRMAHVRLMARVGGDTWVITLKVVRQAGGSVAWCLHGGRGEVVLPWAWWVSRTPDLAGTDAAVRSRSCLASHPSDLDQVC
jgi:hypothetical protein